MGMDDHSPAAFINEIEARLDEVNIPKSLSEIGVPIDCAQRIAEKALLDSAYATNPRKAEVAEVKALIEAAITKAR